MQSRAVIRWILVAITSLCLLGWSVQLARPVALYQSKSLVNVPPRGGSYLVRLPSAPEDAPANAPEARADQEYAFAEVLLQNGRLFLRRRLLRHEPIPDYVYYGLAGQFGDEYAEWCRQHCRLQLRTNPYVAVPLLPFVIIGALLLWWTRTIPDFYDVGCCQSCGYALQGLTQSRCPECGAEVRSEPAEDTF